MQRWPNKFWYVCSDHPVVVSTLKVIEKENEEEVLQDESLGAGESVRKLQLDVHLARKTLRDGESLAKKRDSDKIRIDWLPHQQ